MLMFKPSVVLLVIVFAGVVSESASTTTLTTDTVTFDLRGIVTDDSGQPVAAATIYLDFVTSTAPGTYYSHASTVSDEAGAYRIVFAAAPGALAGGATAFASVWKGGLESDYRYFKPATADPAQMLNFRMYRVNRITAGDSTVVTINPDDPICVNNVQDMPGLNQDYVCRTVRVVAPRDGVMTLEAHGSQPRLEVETVNVSPCCSEQLANPATIQVSAGTEVMANIEMRYGSTTSQSFVLTTSMPGVTVPPNSAPSVLITAPTAGATFTAPATVTLTATANDVNGTIASVRFYAGPLFIGTATASPPTVTWSGVPAGTYTLTAVATDDGGLSTTSPGVPITVFARPAVSFVFSCVRLACSFDGSASQGDIASYAWSFGDGATGTGLTAAHSYAVPGTYTVALIVRGRAGATNEQRQSVTVKRRSNRAVHGA